MSKTGKLPWSIEMSANDRIQEVNLPLLGEGKLRGLQVQKDEDLQKSRQ